MARYCDRCDQPAVWRRDMEHPTFMHSDEAACNKCKDDSSKFNKTEEPKLQWESIPKVGVR